MKLSAPVTLSALAEQVPNGIAPAAAAQRISQILDDSRKADATALYVAYPGADVAQYIQDAAGRGAAVLLDQQTFGAIGVLSAPAIIVEDVASAAATLASWAMGRPEQELQLAGVTGTNGKTTVTHMLEAILLHCGLRPAIIGTLGVRYGETAYETGYTTPPALELYPLLREMRKAGVDTVAMEVSSHALALGRVAGLRFAVGMFTNLSRDHLDFHRTFDAYIEAKSRLFAQCDTPVINIDDEVGRSYFASFGGVGYSLEPRGTWTDVSSSAQVLRAENIAMRADGSEFTVEGIGVRLALPGRFNIANALAALGAAQRLGIALFDAAAGLSELHAVPGRMERFEAAGCTVVVDYAHTPDALERVLLAARETQPKRLTVVFGCGGGRDRGKRPEMGAIAERYADRCIVTSDNPRHEDPLEIIAEIRAGMQHAPEIEPDRARAIERAVGEAAEGELIVIAGKGAETVQIVGGSRTHFDDREEVRKRLAARAGERKDAV